MISQQLSNEPGVPLGLGRFAGELERLVAMFLHEFGAPKTPVRPTAARSRGGKEVAT